MKKVMIIVLFLTGLMVGQKRELKNVKVLPFKTKRELVSYMKKVVVPELGVKCNFCHNLTDYSSDEKDHKKVARKMMTMVNTANQTMNELNFHEISCWVCHQGNNHPEHPSKKK